MTTDTYRYEDASELATFESTTAYEDYVHASVLCSLQQTLTEAPDELGFLVTTQVMELWFELVIHEWRSACEALAADDLRTAMAALERSRRAHVALNGSWAPLAAPTPGRFNAFRPVLGRASGAQSVRYRMMEFLLGEKSPVILESHRGDPGEYAALRRVYERPCLWDEVLRFLHRRGCNVPGEIVQRDVTVDYRAHAGVTAAWQRIYAGPGDEPLLALGELLTDVAELVQRWRSDHVTVVRRAMGAKPGTGGSSGLEWLERRADRLVFPELWEARDGA